MTKGPEINPNSHAGAQTRTCGECSHCCTHLEIASSPQFSFRLDNGEDVAKPSGQACRYLAPHGCSIYPVRPPVCREFKCDWLIGDPEYGDDDTPANTGVIGVRGIRWHFKVRG